VTVPTERQIRSGYERTFPRTAEDIVAIYKSSDIQKRMELEFDYPTSSEAKEHTLEFEQTIAQEKSSDILTKRAPTTVGFGAQLKAAVTRQYQILRGDKSVVIIKQVSNIVQALSSGSLFYNAPNTSIGLFIKSGALFVSLLFNVLLTQSEVTDSFTGRPVLAKHRSFSLYNPIAWCMAQIIVSLTMEASRFFIFWFIVFSATTCMTALFRAVGAGSKNFDDAAKIAGVLVLSLLLYVGYMIPKPEMHPWFVWYVLICYSHGGLFTNVQSGFTGSTPWHTHITHCCPMSLLERLFPALVPILFPMELVMVTPSIKPAPAYVVLPSAPLLLQANSILPV
jgi:ATP-binding cassette subfamily G (WHITE) protein 2 (SNQ2)